MRPRYFTIGDSTQNENFRREGHVQKGTAAKLCQAWHLTRISCIVVCHAVRSGLSEGYLTFYNRCTFNFTIIS